MDKSSLIGISRLRIGTDGQGITALVAFHGCPLHCKYCLNASCLDPNAKVKRMSPEEVMAEIGKDELYYIATKGGVTFGGGEPLINSQFIKDVLELGAKRWHVTVETSLNVPRKHLEVLLPYIDEYIVDVKDMNPEIYLKYTGSSNEQVISNLRWLIDSVPSWKPSPLNILHNYTIQYDKDNNVMNYWDLYDFNQFEDFVPGDPYTIKGSIKLK